MQLFAKINGAKKEKEDLVDEKGVGSSNEPGPTEHSATGGFTYPHLLFDTSINPFNLLICTLRSDFEGGRKKWFCKLGFFFRLQNYFSATLKIISKSAD